MVSIPRQIGAKHPSWIYFASLLPLSVALALAVYLPSGEVLLWTVPALLALGTGIGLVWYRCAKQTRAQELIASRLARLPSDFLVLHRLRIPAPWGQTQVDHLIVSRFGIVVVANGTTSCWMLEQVEAIRSLLYTYGFQGPQVPVRALVVVPPGVPDGKTIESDAPIVRAERIRLQHIAPAQEAILAPDQVSALVRSLSGLAFDS